MRKNYFAKKLVAYSMAFAVAFSTLTVSPVFVKEAKAATVSVTPAAETTDAVSDGNGILISIESTGTTNPANIAEVQTGIGVKKLLNPGVTVTSKTDDSLGNGAKLAYDEIEITKQMLFKDNSSNNIKSSLKKVVFDDTNKNQVLNASEASTWFKLVPATGTYTKTTGSTTETYTVKYYKVTQLNAVNTATYNLDTVTEDELGIYLAAPQATYATPTANPGAYTLFNVVKDSTLDATPERTTYTAKEGDSLNLVVNAESNETGLKYTWKFGTKELASTTNVCPIEKVDGTTTGVYSCTVTDGVRTQVVGNIGVSVLSHTTYPDPAYTTISKCLYPADYETAELRNTLSGGKVTLTSCMPANEEYVYVWLDSSNAKLNRSENDVLAYDASKNSVTITDKTTAYNTTQVVCYIVPKDAYMTTFATELKNLAKATTDVAKFKALDELLDAEATKQATVSGAAIATETFHLVATNNKYQSSENVVKSVGDSVNLVAPTATLKTTEVAQYTDDDLLNGNDLLGGAKTTEEGKEYNKTALYASEFGAKRFVLAKDVYTKVTSALLDATTYYYFDGKEYVGVLYKTSPSPGQETADKALLDQQKTEGNVFTKSANSTLLAEKFINIVYTPDLKVSADNITAKVGEEVQLSVVASSKLPLDYTWTGTTMASTITKDLKDASKSAKFNVKAGDIYQPKVDVDGDDVHDVADGDKLEAHFVTCTVDNGIESKTVKITIGQNGGFSFVGNDKATYKSTDNIASKTNFTVKGLVNKNITLTPVVTPNEGTELDYKWYKTSTTSDVLSTDAQFTTKYTTGCTYIVVISDKAAPENKVELSYAVSTANVVAADVTIDKIDAQIYTGKAIEPAITVKLTNDFVGDLVKDTDYTATFENNVNAGIARVIVTLSKDLDPTQTVKVESTFPIDRAENKLTVEDKTVVLGGSVQPKTTSVGDAPITYTYYTDKECTKEIPVPSKVGIYYVKATAIATVNYNQAESNVAKVVVAPGKPKIGSTSRTASSITLNWAKTTGATAYRVYIKKNGKFTKVANTTGLKYTVKGLASATTYEFAVKAFVNGVASPVYSVRTTTTAPAKVATPAVKAGSRKATVTFKKVARATGYQVYMAKGNGKYVKVATTAKLSVTKTGLTKGATYKFKVRAYKKVGSNVYYGAFSSAKAVKVK